METGTQLHEPTELDAHRRFVIEQFRTILEIFDHHSGRMDSISRRIDLISDRLRKLEARDDTKT